jgi:hypothetical protein
MRWRKQILAGNIVTLRALYRRTGAAQVETALCRAIVELKELTNAEHRADGVGS